MNQLPDFVEKVLLLNNKHGHGILATKYLHDKTQYGITGLLRGSTLHLEEGGRYGIDGHLICTYHQVGFDGSIHRDIEALVLLEHE